MENSNDWVDHFLFWDAIIVVLLVFADWLLGERNRQAMREAVGNMWVRISDYTFTRVLADDARIALNIISRLGGIRWYSTRFIFLYCSLSLLLTFFFTFFASAILIDGKVSSSLGELYWVFAVPNALLDWVSVAITMMILRLMIRSSSTSTLLSLLIFDVLVAFSLAAGVLAIVYFATNYQLVSGELLYLLRFYFWDTFGLFEDGAHEIASIVTYLGGTTKIAIAAVVVAFTSALPTLAHLGLTLFYISAIFLRPIIQKPLEIVLLRFHESNKGVLTLIAIGLGTFAKIIQEWVGYTQ